MTKRISKEQLQSQCDMHSRQSNLQARALNALVNGNVEWFKDKPHALGICCAAGAEGGIVIHKFYPDGQSAYSSVHLWDDFYPTQRDYCPSYDNTEALRLKELAYKAHNYVLAEQAKEWSNKAA